MCIYCNSSRGLACAILFFLKVRSLHLYCVTCLSGTIPPAKRRCILFKIRDRLFGSPARGVPTPRTPGCTTRTRMRPPRAMIASSCRALCSARAVAPMIRGVFSFTEARVHSQARQVSRTEKRRRRENRLIVRRHDCTRRWCHCHDLSVVARGRQMAACMAWDCPGVLYGGTANACALFASSR